MIFVLAALTEMAKGEQRQQNSQPNQSEEWNCGHGKSYGFKLPPSGVLLSAPLMVGMHRVTHRNLDQLMLLQRSQVVTQILDALLDNSFVLLVEVPEDRAPRRHVR